MNDMTYKGYTAKIEYSAVDGCLIGRVSDIHDIIAFHGNSVSEIKEAFEGSINDYLDFCEELGQAPQKPFSEKIVLNMPQDLYARLTDKAKVDGKSIDNLVIEALNQSTALGA
jgi:predicted HicB family RNase H-like nuclease